MATAYAKTAGDMTIALAAREAMWRPVLFPNWTELRMGMFYSQVGLATDNTAPVTEQLLISSYLDWFTFGLNDASNIIPGAASSLFIGCMTPTDQKNDNGTHNDLGWIGYTAHAGVYGSTVVGGTYASQSSGETTTYPDPTGANGYCGFFGLRMIITDLGLSTQSIGMQASSATYSAPVAGTDYSSLNLRTFLQTITWAPSKSVAWNTGAAARAIPTNLWIRQPLNNNRLRISCWDAIRILPAV